MCHCTWSRRAEGQTQALCELKSTASTEPHPGPLLLLTLHVHGVCNYFCALDYTRFVRDQGSCSLQGSAGSSDCLHGHFPFLFFEAIRIENSLCSHFLLSIWVCCEVSHSGFVSSVPVSSWFSSVVSVSLLLFSFNSLTHFIASVFSSLTAVPSLLLLGFWYLKISHPQQPTPPLWSGVVPAELLEPCKLK